MKEIVAKLKYYHVSPRKVRLVADLIRGKNVNEVFQQLLFSKKKSSSDIMKLLKSAISNAKHNNKIDVEKGNLYIKEIRVDEGPPMKRYRPAWRGTAKQFKRRTSHVVIILEEREKKAKKIKKVIKKKNNKVK